MSGYKTATAGSEQVRAVYWLNGQARDMGMIDDVLSADCYTVWAMDINARDQIIGRGGSVQNDDFVYQNGKMYSLKQILKTYQAIKDFVGQDNFVLPDSLKFNLDGSFDIEIKKYVSTQTTAESQTSISVTSQVKTFNIFLPADLKTLNLPNTSTSQSNN
ncbi:MAG: hypothetical protein COU31_05010 [Candidatus Magasanikbacteria bacterium CG10_big_fil_rev_8_21_14_0_10_40_10]|uniref:Uncharacterized protein n=1 Tax=Candidatus Magasanikbacteria bacterium CG10_big_fil_rev_8_21_14_0_10_40_10 TaxID=1974648 RepID=A0A2M6W2S1_9BACT|nr:MAG: hypothetical protein COU31_05010 [Candidatus Magasanikbacteria bacterium CG10_big_fil_rev_8_21_14_0_10_40_10]